MKKRPDAKGYVEESSDPYRTKSRDGKTILCHACGLAASAAKKLRIVGCDACNHHFHLDCLDPPLVTPPPATTKWMCPLHMDQTAVPKETEVIPIDKPNTPNNGDIDITLSPENRTKAKQIEIIRINGVKYQVPENIIILDFWNKLAKGKDISNAEGQDPNPLLENSPSTTTTTNDNPQTTSTNAEGQDLNPLPENSPSITTTTNDNPQTTSTSPTNSHLDPPSKPKSASVESQFSSGSSFVPPRAPTTPCAKSATKPSKLTCLLQAARQVNDIQKSVPDAGLILLGNAASLQSKVPSNSRVKKKSKPASKPVSSAPRTSTRDCTALQSHSCNPSQPCGCNRSTKSVSMCPETKDTTKLKLLEDQTGSNLNQSLAIAPFNSKHVDVISSNNQTTSLDKRFSCQNSIIASPIHAGCQWTGPQHISLGPARSTIFMGRAGPGLYLKSLGPTHDTARGGPGSADGV